MRLDNRIAIITGAAGGLGRATAERLAQEGAHVLLSDIDVAVYLDARLDLFKRRLSLMEALAKKIGSDRLDLVVLNRAPIVLKYEVIKNGVVLKEDRPRRVLFEASVLRDYLDTAHLRATQYRYLKERLLRSGANG